MTTRLATDVLSLFDGMGCGWIALKELEIVPRRCYASEIDKYAIAQVKLNFPEVEHLGDVTKWREWNIDWSRIGLVLAGSPCQGFSFAGKQLAFDDPRSALFFMFIDILNHVRSFNPNVKFLLENVNMKREHMRVITEYVGVFPVNINSSLVSAQNRNRWYWSNIRTKRVGLFGDVYTDIPQPEDRGILLCDVIDENVDEKYYLSEKSVKALIAHAERAKVAGNGFAKKSALLNGKANPVKVGGAGTDDLVCISSNQKHATVATNKSTPMVSAMGMGGGHIPMIIQSPRGFNKGNLYKDKSPTLSCNSWERNNHVVQLNLSQTFGSQPRQQDRIYAINVKSPTMNTCTGGSKILKQNRIRRLTPTECARLQTIPDWYKWECSQTQQYKMLGNGWTIEVIKHILSCLVI